MKKNKNKDQLIQPTQNNTFSTQDFLLSLCHSVSAVLSEVTHSTITFSPMVQRISKTCLKPDIGTFVLFDGAFSGLVIINFSADAAMEVYTGYLTNMGIPPEELAKSYTSDEVGNVMGELMNQILGDFTSKVSRDLHTYITQSQPKMLTLNKMVKISINANLDKPKAHRVSFHTQNNNMFYMELAMDNTHFLQMDSFEPRENVNPDQILEDYKPTNKSVPAQNPEPTKSEKDEAADLLAELGI